MKKTSRQAASKTKHSVSKPKPVASGHADADYLFQRLCQLYLHSQHARLSFALIVLFSKNKTIQPQPPANRLAFAEAEIEDDPEFAAQQSGWLHKPYPYSGHLRIVVVILSVALLSIVVQIMYPSGRTLPLSRLDGNGYAGLKTSAQIEQTIKHINTQNLTVTTKDSSVSTTPVAMGVRADGEQTFANLSDYPLAQRLIPFSLLFMSAKSQPVARDINVDKLNTFSRNIVTVTSRPATNAQVTLQGTKLVITPSQDGYEYQQNSVQRQIADSKLNSGKPIELVPAMKPAQITTQTAEDSIYAMQKRIDSGLTISAADQNIRIAPETLASWVVITQKPELSAITLSFDREKVAASLRQMVASVDQTGTPDVITLLNGVEAGRKPGTVGRTLQFDDLVSQVTGTTDWTIGLIQANVQQKPAAQTYVRTYSRDSNGAQSLLDYWVKNNKGRNGVDLRTQNGKIEASANAYQLYNGTYKLYLPHLTYGQITTRKLSPGFTTSTGFTIDGCIDKIVLSGHDACSLSLGELIGWSENNSLLAAQGLTSTTIARGSGVTTPHDGAEWATRLLGGGLTTIAQRNSLISLMGEQSVRSGIPAGARGTPVANCAGQSGSVRYDVGIVYHPRGTYMLSVFTDGSSFAAIADLAAQVNQLMGQ